VWPRSRLYSMTVRVLVCANVGQSLATVPECERVITGSGVKVCMCCLFSECRRRGGERKSARRLAVPWSRRAKVQVRELLPARTFGGLVVAVAKE